MKTRTAACGVVNIDGLRCTLQANREAHTFGHYAEDGSQWSLTPDDVSAWRAPHGPSEWARSEARVRVGLWVAFAVIALGVLFPVWAVYGWAGVVIAGALIAGAVWGWRRAVAVTARRIDGDR